MSKKSKTYTSPDWEIVDVEIEESILSGEQIDDGTEYGDDDY